jgi:hypothetical protein
LSATSNRRASVWSTGFTQAEYAGDYYITFKLQNVPKGFINLFGSGADSLLGTDSITGQTDFVNNTKPISIGLLFVQRC